MESRFPVYVSSYVHLTPFFRNRCKSIKFRYFILSLGNNTCHIDVFNSVQFLDLYTATLYITHFYVFRFMWRRLQNKLVVKYKLKQV